MWSDRPAFRVFSALARPACYWLVKSLNHNAMLRWVLTFLIIAIVAGIFGFTGIAAGAASIAKIIFFVFCVLIVLALVFGSAIWKKVN